MNVFSNFCSLFVEDFLQARGQDFCPAEILNSKRQIRQMMGGDNNKDIYYRAGLHSLRASQPHSLSSESWRIRKAVPIIQSEF